MNQWKHRKTREGFAFTTGKTELAWTCKGDSLALAGLKSGGKGFRFGEGSALWRLELRDREGYCTQLSSAQAEGLSYQAGKTLQLTWSKLAGGAVDVKVVITADADKPILRCRLEIANRGGVYTVWSVHMPALTDAVGPTGSHRDDTLITTDGFGSAIPDPIRQPRLTAWTNRGYPNALQTLPLVALTNGGTGLYLGVHDAGGGLVRFQHPPDKDADRLPMAILLEPADAGRAQKAVTFDYDVVIGLFQGDWYDVAMIYRPWALKQKRAARMVKDRTDIPAWSRNLPVWAHVSFPQTPTVSRETMDALADRVLRFRNALGRECGAHVYNWHSHPFDINYPDYTPRPGAKQFVRKLQAGGVRVMPYINGRLFDLDCSLWEADNARRFATKEAAPKVGGCAEKLFTETYGSNTQMAVMCASTKYWQDKVAGIVCRLVKDLGVDGVYVDQIAAAWSEVCSDRSHGHPLRGGSWWIDGYDKMIDETWRQLRKIGRDKDVLLTTECNADAYLHMLGNFLMLHSVRNYVVPMFTAIYAGYAPMFAREADVRDRPTFRIMMAQNILWGCQNGWIGAEQMDLLMSHEYRTELAFLKNLNDLYDRLLPYFDGGTMLRPPVAGGKVKHIDVVWKFCTNWPERVPTVWTAHWQRGKQNALAVVNVLDRPQSVSIALPAGAGKPETWWADGGEGQAQALAGRCQLELPARAMALVQTGTSKTR
ncbi:MAG: DUF6259 domain-containing protein [Planctomycetota bacterium]|nr:DUF6259 domain-containing protein [Planctomycetota bacterium]